MVTRFFQELLSFPQFPPVMDNGCTSLVIAFSYYFLDGNFLTISQFSSNEFLQQRQYMSLIVRSRLKQGLFLDVCIFQQCRCVLHVILRVLSIWGEFRKGRAKDPFGPRER